MKNIKWVNKHSGETGFVKCLAEGHFINTFDQKEAMKFRSIKEADKALDRLFEFGEDVNNDFEIV